MKKPRPPQPPQPPGSSAREVPEVPNTPDPGTSQDPMDPINFRNAQIRRQAAIYTKKIGEAYILYDPLSNHYLRLNDSAHSLWTTVGDHERIPVSEVIGQVGVDFDEGLSTLIFLAERNFIVIVAL